MKNLYIVGAGGFGREVYGWLQDLPECGRDWTVRGFLDDNPDALSGMNYPVGLVGSVSKCQPEANDLYVCGIGSVAEKRRACAPLLGRGADFISLIHPSVIVGPNVQLGQGVVLCPRVTLTCDIKVGAMTLINCHTTVGHDACIGAWVTVSANCDLTGFTEVGDASFLGSGARIIPGKTVGCEATVGAGAVVIRSVGDGQKVFGNPARVFA
ncbi:MAG: sugar O-acyltransferase [Verrucomicrobia bacterium]|nr:sugar O-acyltransferase [Verrucomicrobiota bacterium]